MQAFLKKLEGDKVLWMVTFLLSIISLLSVYSAISTLAMKADGNSLKFLVKHLAMILLGFGTMYFVHKMRFKYFSRTSSVLIWVVAGMLILTLFSGVDINSAKRWLRIPFVGMTFQTSDLAKIVLVTFVARQLNIYRTQLHDFKKGVLPVLIPIAGICVLILPADFSTAAMIGGVCFLMMFIGGVPIKHLGKIAGMGVLAIGLIYLIGTAAPNSLPRLGTWKSRIDSFFSPDANDAGNYQSDLAQAAIYNGGLFPSGPGTGSSRNYLPHPYSDMIYAFVIEEYGALFGGLGLLLLYLILLFRSIKMATRCPKHFGGLLALGLSLMLVCQAIINMGVAVKIFPTTGQPLPLVSMGGTSMIFTCLSIAMIISVSRSVYNEEEWAKENKEDPKPSNQNSYVTA